MSNPRLVSPNADNVVTASDLVRHFGIWQDRATRSPVYILHRGRPRHVLTSVDTMQRLCAAHEEVPAAAEPTRDLVLDLIDDKLVLIDRELRIISASHAARRYFGDAAGVGAGIDRLCSSRGAPFLQAVVERVVTTGHQETLELTGPYPGRRLNYRISPLPGDGAALLVCDSSLPEDLANARAWGLAKRQAAIATRLALPVRINLRGYIENPDGALAGFLGTDARLLATVRFVTLVDLASRVAVGQLIEAVISSGEPSAIDTRLLRDGATTRAVRIGFAPVRSGSTVEGVAAIIVFTEPFQQA